MSVEQLESAILALTLEERQRFALWFEQHRTELLGNQEEELTPEDEQEILHRRELARSHPELIEPWEGPMARVRQRLHELRNPKTSNS